LTTFQHFQPEESVCQCWQLQLPKQGFNRKILPSCIKQIKRELFGFHLMDTYSDDGVFSLDLPMFAPQQHHVLAAVVA
jgi:hypothetical protein